MDILLLVIILSAIVIFLFGFVLVLFLLYLMLKIRTEFRETLRLEVEKNKKIYDFIKQKGKVSVEELVEKFDGMTPQDARFPTAYQKWLSLMQERLVDLGTLEGNKNAISLSDNTKKFLVYNNPSVGDLFKYIMNVYVRRQPFTIE